MLVEKRVKFGKEVQGEIWSLNVHQVKMREKAGLKISSDQWSVSGWKSSICMLSLSNASQVPGYRRTKLQS